MNTTAWTRGMAIAACVAGAALAGCSGNSGSNPPAAASDSTSAEGSGFVAENLIQATATVKSVNAAKRTVVLENTEGRTLSVKVGDNVDLAKVKAGDTVNILYLESVAIDVADPGTATPGVASGVLVVPAQAGQVPAGTVVQQVTATAEVMALDLSKYTVTLRVPDGELKTFTVKNPDLRQKLNRLRVGDLVQATYTEALAIRVEPATGT